MKNRKLTLRITESQFRNLRDRIIDESMTKSEFIRKLLEENEKSCRIEDDVNKNLQNTKNKLLSIIRGIK